MLLIAYLGGVLTIVSPCILPVLPFVFARADRPFVTSGLPLLMGMAVTFALIVTLGAVGGGWVVAANEYARDAALLLMALFGLTLLLPWIAERLTRPLVALGGRLSAAADTREARGRSAAVSSALLGVATGLLWAPCAGPVLGLILTGAALQGATVRTAALLLAYAFGAATALAAALLLGGRVFAAMKRSLGTGEWVRRALGAVVLMAVAAIFLGLDTGLLTRLSAAGTAAFEQKLLDTAGVQPGGGAAAAAKPKTPGDLAPEGPMPSLAGAVTWENSPPLTAERLRGKVVLVDFWTYSCINCLRSIPYVRAWAEKYKDKGLVVIGVHSPEFAFERNPSNVRKAIGDLGITYPVAVDSDRTIWRAFRNAYWPAHYFIDAAGVIRHHHFGEGSYALSEKVIQTLLAEAGADNIADDTVAVKATGAQAASNWSEIGSPETYFGYRRGVNFISPGGAVKDTARNYEVSVPRLNEWGLAGNWTIASDQATLNAANGRVVFRFRARDLHLVLGPSADGTPVRFQVTLDGKPPGEDRGEDIDASGMGVVSNERLYQLVRQKGAPDEHTFEIKFLDAGARAFAFTFG
ncbi:MAG: cytochrome c biogenesis protein DipZ [Rhodospirillaceae bacterium]|nr:cytochrome c biogenesis protein DipZ [Rhodospirillaceae bacterium]